MAKPTPKARQGSSFGGDVRFVNVDLTASQKDDLRKVVDSGALSLDNVFDAVYEGLKFSCRRDAANNSFLATFTWQGNGQGQLSVVLTGRGANPANATLSLVYKHLVICQGAWMDGLFADPASDDFG